MRFETIPQSGSETSSTKASLMLTAAAKVAMRVPLRSASTKASTRRIRVQSHWANNRFKGRFKCFTEVKMVHFH